MSGGMIPNGPAGGELSGLYPYPTLRDEAVELSVVSARGMLLVSPGPNLCSGLSLGTQDQRLYVSIASPGQPIWRDPKSGTWAAPSLQSGWQYSGYGMAQPGYFRNDHGLVYLRGNISGGDLNNLLFSLPVDYRPDQDMIFSVSCGNLQSSVYIRRNGDVLQYRASSNVLLSLDGISFFARSWHV